jgi:hypothetical protein
MVVAVFSVGRLVSDDRPASADMNVDWNICGGHTCGNNGGTAVAAELAYTWSNTSPYPIAVTTQETCDDQFLYLQNALGPRNYKNNRYVSNPNTNSPCHIHGNAVFWLGGCGNGGNCQFNGQWGNQNGEPDVRGWTCGLAGSSPLVQHCSTHLTSNSDPKANLQAQEYYNLLWADRTLYGTVGNGAGDFNLTPGQVPLFYSNGNFVEADAGYNQTTNPAEEKIDYQFFTNVDYCVAPPAAIYDSVYSDHHVYFGYKYGGC